MRLVRGVAMVALLIAVGCSGGSGDEAAFDGEPIEAGTDTGADTPDPTVTDSSTTTTVAPDRIDLDPDAVLDELADGQVDGESPIDISDLISPGNEPSSGAPVTSFREGLVQGGLGAEQADCVVASVASALNLSEAQIDQLVIDEPSNGFLAAASQTAVAECLSAQDLASQISPGMVIPQDTSGTLAEQLESMGLTPTEARCLADLYGDSGTAGENKDFLSCISLDRLATIAG
jgi:hypothetical protein